MVHLSQWITDRLLENVDTKYNKEVYYYVVFKGLSTALFWAMLLLGVLLTKNYYYAIYSVVLTSFRKYTGGFHLNNANICLITSVALVFTAVPITGWVVAQFDISLHLIIFLILITLLGITKLAPVNHPNMALSEAEAKRLKEKVKSLSLYVAGISAVMYILNLNCIIYVFAAVLTDFVLIILAKIAHQDMELS